MANLAIRLPIKGVDKKTRCFQSFLGKSSRRTSQATVSFLKLGLRVLSLSKEKPMQIPGLR